MRRRARFPAARTREEFGNDLAALIEHLRLDDVRLVAQSMGGCSALEYMLNHAHNVRALVLASTCGTIHKPSVPLADRQRLGALAVPGGGGPRRHAATRDRAARGGAHGARTAGSAFPLPRDREREQQLRSGSAAQAQRRPVDALARRIARPHRADLVHHRRRRHDLSAVLVGRAGPAHAQCPRRTGRRTPDTRSISSGRRSSINRSIGSLPTFRQHLVNST